MMADERLPHRTLKTVFWLAVFFTALFGIRGQYSIAAGLAAGAGLGLFALWSLIFVIPRLFSPEGAAGAKAGLYIAGFMKMPIYAISIYLILSTHLVNPIAVIAGVALIPAILVLKVVGNQLLTKLNGDEACRSKIIPSE